MILLSFAVMASVLSSNTMKAYSTCPFLWARYVEKAQSQGQPMPVAALGPLAAAPA